MTLAQIREMIMFQMGLDAEDAADYQPHLTEYINEGYDRLAEAWCGRHVDDRCGFTPLTRDRAEPMLPQWTHRALADWAVWKLMLCGGAARQSRGLPFRQSFEQTLSRLRREGARRFRNWQ